MATLPGSNRAEHDLKDRIAADLKEAMKAGTSFASTRCARRFPALSYKRTEAGGDLSEADELDVVRKLVKQRGDSIAEFERAGRTELADKEKREREILGGLFAAAEDPPTRSAQIVRAALAELPAGAAQSGSRHEGRHAGAQRPGRRQPGPPIVTEDWLIAELLEEPRREPRASQRVP